MALFYQQKSELVCDINRDIFRGGNQNIVIGDASL